MCKGTADCTRLLRKERETCCELCGLEACLYCEADDAYLCRRCDRRVHGANFLAFRHIRCFLCNSCRNLSRRYLIGESLEVVLPDNTGTYRKCSRLHTNPFLFF
ncbi:hypothetical protein V8G54_025751 [Vigna mungo]|uniref:B box-type domain-containing protein n=1 Tax=Vigna mungo TaxID=3915 RepID=A0AAQ3MYV1_VIGMU